MPPDYPVLCAMGDKCRSPDEGGPRPTNRAWVCDICAYRAARQLRDIADAWPDLDAALTTTGGTGGERGGRQRHGAIVHTLPYNERAANARRQAAAHLWFLVRTLAECRPTVHLPVPDDAPTIARWLADWHMPTLVTKPGLYTTTTIIDDTTTVYRRVRAAAYPRPFIRRQPTGVACDTDECPGGYLAVIGAGIATDLICDTDPAHIVPPAVWQRHSWVRAHRPIDLTRITRRLTHTGGES